MEKRHLLTSAILAIAATATTPAFAEDMLVERVRYCTSRGIENICKDSQLNPKFAAWQATQRQEQLETYISIINEPPRDQVKRVVFVSAGQQINDGYPNALTGQPDKYKKDCKNRTRTCTRSIHPMSLVGRLRASGEFNDDETLYISVLDAKFGYFRSFSQKQTLENTYWNFLTSKFDPANVELMVLAGQSRGGCLTFRLGSRMRKTNAYKNIPLIVQGYDPVCTTTDNQVGGLELPEGKVKIAPEATINFNKINNPLNGSFTSYVVDMDKVFPPESRDKLKVLDIHAGGKVAGINTIRSFTWYNKDTDIDWWKQKWVNYEHNDMGGYLASASDTAHARPEIGDVGYGHIYNYSHYDLPDLLEEELNEELNRVYPTNFRAKQRFPVDVNGDKKSDIVLAYQDPVKGLTLRTKLSNGDGTFQSVQQELGDGKCNKKNLPLMSGYFNDDQNSDILILCHHKTNGLLLRVKMSNGDGTYTEEEYRAGDGVNVLDLQPFVGDVNKDGLSDVILRYQNPATGLHILTKLSNGDGSFTEHDFRAGDGNLGEYQRAHVGDLNGDKKSDLIYLFKRASDGKMDIRTRTSNGDGTYAPRNSTLVEGLNWENIQTFVADVNRDKRSDLIVLERKKNAELLARTFITQLDGSFELVTHKFSDGNEVDQLETLIADINGDLRSDIVMRVRDKDNGLMIRVKQSKGDGTYIDKEYAAGDGVQVDHTRALIGNYDDGRLADFALRFRHSRNGLYIRTKMGTSAGSFTEKDYNSQDGSAFDKKEALSGTVHWSGGGTFRYRSSIPGLNAPAVAVVKKPFSPPGRPSITTKKPRVLAPAKPLKLEPKKGVLKNRSASKKSE